MNRDGRLRFPNRFPISRRRGLIMKEQRITPILHELAEQEVPDNLDLWPAIRTRVESGRWMQHRPSANLRLKVAIGLAVLALASIGLLVSVPSTQAAIVHMLQRFGLVLIDPSAMKSTTSVKAEPVGQPTPPLTLAEAQSQAPFPIRIPTWLPEGLALAGAYVKLDNGLAADRKPLADVTVIYHRTSEPQGTTPGEMLLTITSRPNPAGFVVPNSREQEAMINGQAGVYTHGGWRDDGQGDPQTALGNLRWDDALDEARLSWTEDGLTYTLQAVGLGLSREDMVRIAESLR